MLPSSTPPPASSRSGPIHRASNNGSPCCGKRPRTPRPPEEQDVTAVGNANNCNCDHSTAAISNSSEERASSTSSHSFQHEAVPNEQNKDVNGEGNTGVENHLYYYCSEESSEGEPHLKMARSSPILDPECVEESSKEDTDEAGRHNGEWMTISEHSADTKPKQQSMRADGDKHEEEHSMEKEETENEREIFPGEADKREEAEEDEKQSADLPLATNIRDYIKPGATRRYRPRPEWYIGDSSAGQQAAQPQSDIDASVSQAHQPPQIMPFYRPPIAGHMVAPDNGQLSDSAFADFYDVPLNNNNHPSVQPNIFYNEEDDEDAVEPGNPLFIPQLHQNGSRPNNSNHHQQQPTDLIAAPTSAVSPLSGTSSEQSQGPTKGTASNDDQELAQSSVPMPAKFGRDLDPALLVTIRESANEATLELLRWGASVEAENAKGVTPLILASQKGNIAIVEELLRRGANPLRTTVNGTTAVLQAAHFGHLDVLHLLLKAGGPALVEMANSNHTTPLMRAAQEGHVLIVQALLDRGASVNRRNRVQMTALMLASQRGHAEVCQALVNKNAELDSMTYQHSTALLLACKRGNVNVARVLITAGCELWVQDSRGRTARELAQRRDMKELVSILDSHVQLDWMQQEQRKKRNYEMIAIWNLLQEERALIPLHAEEDVRPRYVSIHQIMKELQQTPPQQLSMNKRNNMPPTLPYHLSQPSTQALLRTMTLPQPLVELITKFLPLPRMWEKRVGMISKRSVINADAAVMCSLDLIDEILEEGGFLEACDYTNVTPPTHFPSWVSVFYSFQNLTPV